MILVWVLHTVYSTGLAYILATLLGGLSFSIAAFSLIMGTWFAFRHERAFRIDGQVRLHFAGDLRFFRLTPGEAGVLEALISAVVVYAAWRHFMWMFFPMELSWSTLSANNFGDLPMHINFIRAFTNGITFPPRNPIFATELLRYPFGPDLYNALWESVGVRLQAHLFFTGMLATLASLVLLRCFAGWWGMGAFFLSGGLAGWEVLRGARFADFQNTVEWKNLFLTVFVTQRGVLFALPIGLLLLLSLRQSYVAPNLEPTVAPPKAAPKFALAMGLLWGFLPLFHLHAFVVISLMMAGVASEMNPRAWSGVLQLLRSRMAVVAYVPATFFVLYSTDFLQRSGGIVHWSWGWTAPHGQLAGFLIHNFGPWLIVPLVVALAIKFSTGVLDRASQRRAWIEFITYSFLFVLFMNLMLAPWDWDNIKLLIWPYLGFARLLWICVEPRMGKWLGSLERPLAATILFFSGFVVIAWTLQSPVGRAVPLYQVGDLAYTEGALAAVPANAIFAASPTHQHPLTFFGRLRALGYEGHLWSHGIDASVVKNKLERIMGDDPDFVRLAREVGVTHIFWGPDERLRWGNHSRSWMKSLEQVSRVAGYEIYAVK